MPTQLQLLHLLCWTPVHVLTVPSIRTATFVWTWLVGTLPSVQTTLLLKIFALWKWTMEQRVGLYAGHIAGPRTKYVVALVGWCANKAWARSSR